MGDPIRVIEAAYACELDAPAWVASMVEAVAPFLSVPKSLGISGWLYDNRDPDRPVVPAHTSLKVAPRHHANMRKMNEMPRRGALVERAHDASFGRSPPIASSAELMAGPVYESFWLPQMRKITETKHDVVRDFVAINAVERPHVGFMVGVLLPKMRKIEPAQHALWSHLCAHVAAAMRLRRKLASQSLDPRADEAIVTTTGRVEHATGTAKQRRATEELIVAAKAIERARGKLRARDPETAVSIWRGLVDGRWTLVDYAVEGSRRYLVAKANAPSTPEVARLSARQRQVLFYVCQGHSNKLIAYELGLTPATVATHLRRAAGLLGVRSRADLIARCYRSFVGARDGDWTE